MFNHFTVLLSRKKMPAIVPVFLCLASLWIFTSILIPQFATYSRVMEILHTASFLGIVAMAQTTVVIMGGIDLSVSGVMTLSAMIAAAFLAGGMNEVAAIFLTVLCCSVVGVFNATGINFLSIPPMIMTMATLSIIEGGLLLATNGTPPSANPEVISALAKGSFAFGVPNSVWVWALVTVGAYWLLNRSRYGRYLYGIGTNQQAAVLSGVKTKQVSFVIYIVSSALAGLAGILYFGYLNNAYINLGTPFQMNSIAATVLGGTSIIGGRGNCLGTVAGALILVRMGERKLRDEQTVKRRIACKRAYLFTRGMCCARACPLCLTPLRMPE